MKKNPYAGMFLKVFSVTIGIGLLALAVVFVITIFGGFGSLDEIDINSLTSNSSTQVFYTDNNGNQHPLTTLSAEQNRIWVDFKDIPQDMKDAIVSIEDERFYTHRGFDFKRTTRAFFEFIKNKVTRKPTTFGGSTITQQLVKNITQQRDRTAARKVLEISRAINLERQISKDKILELYLNSIYLSQGCSGVQAASYKFFGKPISDLNLAECASIAGITQYPSLYDPIVNPENNKKKQEVVLGKMLELGYISQSEYDEAVAAKLEITQVDPEELNNGTVNSYFVDYLIQKVIHDLVDKGYSEALASKMIYSGGLKINATIDPTVQEAIETVFENTKNFPGSGSGTNPAQSSMVVMDPKTGEIKGLVGGVGKKSGNLILNRATQTLRQPGSTIKPIAVYAPAFEYNLITPADIYDDKAINYGGWTPRNYDHRYTGKVSVRVALRRSLNTIPVQILNKMGPDRSYNFMVKKLGFTSLVKNETNSSGQVFSDIGLSQLALGGLTHGVSVLELTAAYAPFANHGIYTEPCCYTSVIDSEGTVILAAEQQKSVAMSEQTAFVTSMLLREVVTSGTGVGAQLPSGMFTAGKTGTTSDNHDRWFVGYTPHYVAAVWYGYDTQKTISAPGNPCIPVWRNVMSSINSGKAAVVPAAPSGVKQLSYCTATGLLPGKNCAESLSTCWFISGNTPTKTCDALHSAQNEPDEENPTEQPGDNPGESTPSEGETSGNSKPPAVEEQPSTI